MTEYEPKRVLVEATMMDQDPDIDGDVFFEINRIRAYAAASSVHPAPPEWAQPWPEGVWQATDAEVRERGLWWRAVEGFREVRHDPVDPANWNTTSIGLTDTDIVLAREPIPARRTVSFTLPADATDQAARDEASRVWREAADQ